MEDLLDTLATNLIGRLDSLLERLDAEPVPLPFEEPAKTTGPACLGSGLDFIADPQTGWPLTRGASRQAATRERFTAQIALCDVCGVQAECLANAEPIGIWGGTFPHERKQDE